MAFLSVISGYKTYIAAAGLAGLAVYQFSQGQLEPAVQSFLAALTAAGLRHAVAKAPA
jgi:hypothetical protein